MIRFAIVDFTVAGPSRIDWYTEFDHAAHAHRPDGLGMYGLGRAGR